MSLKAKIEAVIYASEEPVTLAQLVSLLGEEAQAELDRAAAAQGQLSLNETEADLESAAEQDPTLAPEAEAAEPNDPETASSPAEIHSPEPQDPSAAVALSAQPEEPAALAKAERARASRLRAHFRAVVDGLVAEYTTSDRGLEIREIAGGFRFATKPEYHDAVRGFVRSLKPPLKLSLQALETLAVIAYKQPVTAPEIGEIRGVDSAGVLGSLMTRKLITTAGRKQVIGRPILYKTTKEFLLKFGLKDTSELPSIEEFERMAGQMAEQEEISMPDTADPRPDVDPELERSAERLEPEANEHMSQPDGYSSPTANLDPVPQEKAGIDGRLPSLPPDYNADPEDDPSAREAEIQSEQNS